MKHPVDTKRFELTANIEIDRRRTITSRRPPNNVYISMLESLKEFEEALLKFVIKRSFVPCLLFLLLLFCIFKNIAKSTYLVGTKITIDG